MAFKKVSAMTQISSPAASDYFYVSQATGGGGYDSRRLSYADLVAKLKTEGIKEVVNPWLTEVALTTIFSGIDTRDDSVRLDTDTTRLAVRWGGSLGSWYGRVYTTSVLTSPYLIKSSKKLTIKYWSGAFADHGDGKSDADFNILRWFDDDPKAGNNNGTNIWYHDNGTYGNVGYGIKATSSSETITFERGGNYYYLLGTGTGPFVPDFSGHDTAIYSGKILENAARYDFTIERPATFQLYSLSGGVGNLFSV